MSLDVYLEIENAHVPDDGGIYIREGGKNKKITREEWDMRYPNREPITVSTYIESGCVYSDNITHNLNTMASEAGIYKHLWRPEELNITIAKELIEPLEMGLVELETNPKKYKQFNPSNGWGDFNGLIEFVKNYLDACVKYPDAIIRISR